MAGCYKNATGEQDVTKIQRGNNGRMLRKYSDGRGATYDVKARAAMSRPHTSDTAAMENAVEDVK